MAKTLVSLARGDGIGPEIMDVVVFLLKEIGAPLEFDEAELGEKVFKRGIMNGIDAKAWESIRNSRLLLKAPITTPQGGGYKSVNVTMRKSFGQFANVRPVRTYDGFVASKHKNVDMIIIRENEEDLYAGIEYRQTFDTCHSVKLLSRTGCELIVRYAFEYARCNGRKKVTCLVKDNIMKITDGLFHKVFDQIGAEYPELTKDTLIVDIGMARVADTPERFDVVVTENLYGDIVSDIASQVAGSVGLAGSMNIGHGCAMFEAVHGSAPDIAGKGIANPSGLINAAVMMLSHIGQGEASATLGNALLCTLEEGLHTVDIAKDKSKALSTTEFGRAVAKNLGRLPSSLKAYQGTSGKALQLPPRVSSSPDRTEKKLVGVDVFVDSRKPHLEEFGKRIANCSVPKLKFVHLSSRGLPVFPGTPEVEPLGDLWACRFLAEEKTLVQADVRALLHSLEEAGIEWVKVENLYSFGGAPGFSGGDSE